MSSKLFFLALLLVFANTTMAAPLDGIDTSVAIESSPEPTPFQHELVNFLVLDTYSNWAPDLNWPRLREFYSRRLMEPVWISANTPNERANIFKNTVVDAEYDGLDPRDYHVQAIVRLWVHKKPSSQAKLELLLTDALFRYAAEVRVGYQYPRAVDPEWFIKPNKVDALELVTSLLNAKDFTVALANLPPPHPAYRRLRDVLQEYRAYAAEGEWARVPNGPILRLGSQGKRVQKLRQRLLREGYAAGAASNIDDQLFDSTLELAVKQYQRNNGHKEDGVVGRVTRYSLNLSLDSRIKQIVQNMERWRWLPRSLGNQYVMVNMAGYKMYYVERERVAIDMRVIIGLPYRATPAFTDQLEYIEFNPTWSVPPRIAAEDILPKLRVDSNFLKVNHFKLYEDWNDGARELDPAEVDWNTLEDRRFPFKLEQQPGRGNSLGRMKFMFPNSFNVYLHDTPSRGLFNESERTFSSGCIRVARPVTLAARMLGLKNGWTTRDIRKMISTNTTVRIPLEKPIPIYLLYWTAWVEEDGTVHFRRDIYQRNSNISASITAGTKNA